MVAVHDPDPERARRFAAAEGAVVAASVAEVLERSEVVFVCTWTSAHREVVEAVAAAGLPVMCEKPLGTDLADAVAVASAVDGLPSERGRAGAADQPGLSGGAGAAGRTRGRAS